MNHDEISYALAKQLDSAYAIESNYGAIELDDELRTAIDAAVRPILERRLNHPQVVAFEAWCDRNEYDRARRLDGTGYNNCATARAWLAWQAAQAQSDVKAAHAD